MYDGCLLGTSFSFTFLLFSFQDNENDSVCDGDENEMGHCHANIYKMFNFVYSQTIHLDMDKWVMDGYLENADAWVGALAIGWDHWLSTTIYDKLTDIWFEVDA